jgi:hypothetical protein
MGKNNHIVARCCHQIKHMPEMEDPTDLKVELRSYQKQALHWLLQRERDGDSAELKEQLDLLLE